ncbi:GIY-YIG nuclease family protein [uncultured Rhodoblastus sp.]|uniref:GIY-YIG nuclease family protein n=1 Tax=uncultured Rhodoblastus sp. TaxID=543037 RepID=UPI0025FF7D8B|nr:hypothetical protein [uncultured Rhodoblastus sp.]
MADLSTIKTQLLEKHRAQKIPASVGAGVYAFFLAEANVIDGLSVEPPGLIYLGMTDTSLEKRNHFHHAHSGFSSLRRSLGALLKEPLRLRAIPRAPGQSPSNTRNYRFRDEDELRLTDWMKSHLTYGFANVEVAANMVEKELIATLQPPLNLKGWPNPQRRHLLALRAVCKDEAFAARFLDHQE